MAESLAWQAVHTLLRLQDRATFAQMVARIDAAHPENLPALLDLMTAQGIIRPAAAGGYELVPRESDGEVIEAVRTQLTRVANIRTVMPAVSDTARLDAVIAAANDRLARMPDALPD